MRSSSREEIVEVLDALRTAHKRALDLTFDMLTTPERLTVVERFEGFRRQQPAVEHALINQLVEQADAAELGGRLAAVLADRLQISRAEACAVVTKDPARSLRRRADTAPQVTGPVVPVR